MNEAYAEKLRKTHTLVWLFLGMLVYKFSMDLAYLYLTEVFGYVLSFNPLKYTLGLVWCVVLFVFIRHTEHRVSSFFLYYIFLFQIVPITSVYALGDHSTAYYALLCLSFLLCELTVGHTGERPLFRRNLIVSRTMTLCFGIGAAAVLLNIIWKNGAPHLSLLNIYTVYEYRSSGAFQIGKYMNYILTWTIFVYLPLGLARALTKRSYSRTLLMGGLMVLLYLYTGHKSMLFGAPFVILLTLWARRKHCYQELFLSGCCGFSIVTMLTYFSEPGSLWYHINNLFTRRVMLLTAQNKFLYYDYFSNRPKLGIYGLFPTWIVKIPSYYEGVNITHDISSIYYDKPDMGTNTGFFAEGYARFGYIGIILLLLLFALLLKQTDRLQDRVGYQLAVGIFVYPVLNLTDGFLLDSLVFGPWTWLTAILLFYMIKTAPPRPRPAGALPRISLRGGGGPRRTGIQCEK